jgi:hypothetical protein
MTEVSPEQAFCPTGPKQWLLSFPETRRELAAHAGLEVWPVHLVGYAAALTGARWLIEQALVELVEDGTLEPVRYAPWLPQPLFPPDPSFGCAQPLSTMTETHGWRHRRSPASSWVYRVRSSTAPTEPSPST